MNKMLKECKFTLKVISPLILSPRSSEQFYVGIDYQSDEVDDVNIIYPFYRYGDYTEYKPEGIQYYIPGSSIKGALKSLISVENNENWLVDDILVEKEDIVVRTMEKFQKTGSQDALKLNPFFQKIGVEMLEEGRSYTGRLFCSENWLLKLEQVMQVGMRERLVNNITRINGLLKGNDCENLEGLRDRLEKLIEVESIIFLGGYKGLIHSLENYSGKDEIESGIYVARKMEMEDFLIPGIVQLEFK
ncbi:RAMP superfamily CRISPR-associated protein [Listeria goaensis]|uniref:RAMP superfamily CRISPR-associated protein n=1 Tax=Listeria goaensis TaxID=1649188 RepID=UPI000B5960F0|nr:RAMP superfamily CRISPR-associated protein [Listeria goaensis]